MSGEEKARLKERIFMDLIEKKGSYFRKKIHGVWVDERDKKDIFSVICITEKIKPKTRNRLFNYLREKYKGIPFSFEYSSGFKAY